LTQFVAIELGFEFRSKRTQQSAPLRGEMLLEQRIDDSGHGWQVRVLELD
jgi:hypothetical protein